MSRKVGIAGDLIIGMLITKLVVIHNHGNGKGDYFAFIFYTNLAVAKSCNLCLVVFIGPGTTDIAVDIVHEFLHILVVIQGQVSQIEMVFGIFSI